MTANESNDFNRRATPERRLIPADKVFADLELLESQASTINLLPVDHPFREAYLAESLLIDESEATAIDNLDALKESKEEILSFRFTALNPFRHRPQHRRLDTIVEVDRERAKKGKEANLQTFLSAMKKLVIIDMAHDMLRSYPENAIQKNADLYLRKIAKVIDDQELFRTFVDGPFSDTAHYAEIQTFSGQLLQEAKDYGPLDL